MVGDCRQLEALIHEEFWLIEAALDGFLYPYVILRKK